MRILYIWDADYPWDVRVEKICRSLAARAHEMHIAARNLRRLPVHEAYNGLHIHRLRTFPGDWLNYTLSFPAFFSPIWLRFLTRTIREHSIEAVIVRDLPMAVAGLWAARRHNIPVVFDNAEDYVAMLRVMWKQSKFQGFNLLVRNPFLAKQVERYTMPRVDRILVVSEDMVSVCKQAGAEPDRISIVGNTPTLASLAPSTAPDRLDLSRFNGRWSAIYTGGLQPERGLDYVVEALPTVVKEIPGFLLVIVGDGSDRGHLERMVRQLGLESHVWFVGWVDHRDLFHYIRASKVGLIPHLVSPHVDTTIPNKIYDYMGCGIPVVASDARPLKRILQEAGAGVVFRSGDSRDFIRAVLEVRASDANLGAQGRRAVADHLNWNRDEEVLWHAVESVQRRVSPRRSRRKY